MSYKLRFILAACLTLIVSSGCSEKSPTPPTGLVTPTFIESTPIPNRIEMASITHINYPNVDGSTSAYPMQIQIACSILEVSCGWHDAGPFELTRRLGPDLLISDPSGAVDRIHEIWHSGTHSAYMNLIGGGSDIILVARPPSDDELAAAKEEGIKFELRPVALDAFVFLSHKENPVESVSLSDLRSTYTGEITDWVELGGLPGSIHTYQRNRNSGSQELMEKLVMRGAEMIDSPDMILESMMGPINAISEDPLGLGYSVYFYAEYIFPHEKVNVLAVDGIFPTLESIAERSYPLSTEVYAVIREGTPSDDPARTLFDWLLTEKGQAAVAQSGYVPFHP
jgi:phosphate transport system substrate-binding protein